MLFIHGTEDTFVHTDMIYDVCNACNTPKDMLLIEGAGHAESYKLEPETYFNKVFEFIDTNCINLD